MKCHAQTAARTAPHSPVRPMHNAIALFSSSRRNGNTGQLIDRIAGELNIEVVDLSTKRMSPFDYEHLNRDDDFEPLMKRVLAFDQIIFATPVYWYAVSPAMRVFLDRITDFLELPDLLAEGRRLRGKHAYVVCTSIYDEAPASFTGTFVDTVSYLGMHFGGVAHVNCRDGYIPAKHDAEAAAFARRVRDARPAPGIARA
jgi:multimeric flavodoxin WrbA